MPLVGREANVHELGLARGLVSQAQRIAGQHDAERIDEIVVRIGALSGVETDLLARAFVAARVGSIAERAILTIEQRPLEVRCAQCKWSGPVALNNMACADCGAQNVDVVAGTELVLVRLELAHLNGIASDNDQNELRRDTPPPPRGGNS